MAFLKTFIIYKKKIFILSMIYWDTAHLWKSRIQPKRENFENIDFRKVIIRWWMFDKDIILWWMFDKVIILTIDKFSLLNLLQIRNVLIKIFKTTTFLSSSLCFLGVSKHIVQLVQLYLDPNHFPFVLIFQLTNVVGVAVESNEARLYHHL